MSAASSTPNLHWCPVIEKSQLDSIVTLKIGLKATLWKSSIVEKEAWISQESYPHLYLQLA